MGGPAVSLQPGFTMNPLKIADSGPQADAPLSFTWDAQMASHTEALWTSADAHNRHSFFFHDPDDAPSAVSATVGADVDFMIPTLATPAQFPWTLYPPASHLNIRAWVAVDNASLPVTVSASSVQLILAQASHRSRQVPVDFNAIPPSGLWAYGNSSWAVGLFNIRKLMTGNVPADQRVAIKFSARFNAAQDPGGVNNTRTAKILALEMFDSTINPQPEQ